MKIVYDFGANNGSNIPYYLLKFDKIIAVEANPKLIHEMSIKFENEIRDGRLILINCVVSLKSENVKFFIHKDKSVWSQFPVPNDIKNFYTIDIISKKASDIVREHGDAEYIKIDVEYIDSQVISDLFENKIFPRYISSEVQDVLVFSLITASQKYDCYKLLDGKSINDIYRNVNINGASYTFPIHSAGPMWEDIPQKSMNLRELFDELHKQGLGWRDIHAKRS